MSAYTMPSNRGARCSGVPQPKPRHCPPGHHRCGECNALVRDGQECAECARKAACDDRRSGNLYVNSVDCGAAKAWVEVDLTRLPLAECSCGRAFLPKRTRGGGYSDKCPKCLYDMREKGTKVGRAYKPKGASTHSVTRVCERCGAHFEQGNIGRPARWCHACRKLPIDRRIDNG